MAGATPPLGMSCVSAQSGRWRNKEPQGRSGALWRERVGREIAGAYLSGIVNDGFPAAWIALSPNDVKVAPPARDPLVALPNSFAPDMNTVLPAATATEATG